MLLRQQNHKSLIKEMKFLLVHVEEKLHNIAQVIPQDLSVAREKNGNEVIRSRCFLFWSIYNNPFGLIFSEWQLKMREVSWLPPQLRKRCHVGDFVLMFHISTSTTTLRQL
jgi:hypothetical protein